MTAYGIVKFLTVIVVLVAIFLSYLELTVPEAVADIYRMTENIDELREKYAAGNHSAFVLGYTGETGKALVPELLRSGLFTRLVLIGRREVKYDDELYKAAEQKVVDFDKLEDFSETFQGFDEGFCCLGTTKGKAGKDGFYKVDHDYIVNSAKLAKDGGCRHFHLTSSNGASANSWLLYPKVKGQVEEELKQFGFERLSIYRPGLLMCDREESRPMERGLRLLMKPFAYAFPTAITTPTKTLARAMINAAVMPAAGPANTYEIKAISALANEDKKTKQTKE